MGNSVSSPPAGGRGSESCELARYSQRGGQVGGAFDIFAQRPQRSQRKRKRIYREARKTAQLHSRIAVWRAGHVVLFAERRGCGSPKFSEVQPNGDRGMWCDGGRGGGKTGVMLAHAQAWSITGYCRKAVSFAEAPCRRRDVRRAGVTERNRTPGDTEYGVPAALTRDFPESLLRAKRSNPEHR